jgi:putative Holliday junction resolvase
MSDRYLALDVGERRTGVAATDYTGTIIVPLETIQHHGMAELPERLAPLLAERETQVLVVGIPLNTDGSVGPQAQKVLNIAEELRKHFPELEHLQVDESHSSDVAHAQMKEAGIKAARRRKHADALAAVEILRRATGL